MEQLDVKGAITNLALPVDTKDASKRQGKAKPVQPARRNKRTRDEAAPVATRQSLRLRRETIDPNESPSKRIKREVCCSLCIFCVAFSEAWRCSNLLNADDG